MQRGLRIRSGNLAEVGVVDVQSWVRRFRMIKDVAGVDSELQRLGFGNPELLTHVGIEPPASGNLDSPLPESPAMSRKWVLENDLTRIRIENRVKRAKSIEIQ